MFRFARLFTLLFAITFVSTAALSQVTFTPGSIPSGDTGSGSIASADFNDDGILDLVTINATTLSFYKGLGGGNYANPINQTIPSNLGQVVAADFSKHGTPDLAIAGPQGIIILIGNNNGTFTQGTNINLGGRAVSLALADFNGDLQPDIAVSTCPTSGSCGTKVYLGQGNGHFTLSSTLADGGGPILAGDFDANGHQDIMVSTESLVALYLGNGNGLFQAPVVANLATNFMAIGDFYGTHRIQSVVALTGQFLGGGDFETEIFTLRYSGGKLLVENEQVVQASTGVPYQFVAAGDLNGDFKDDVFLTGGDVNGQFSAYVLNNGNATFQPPVDVPTPQGLPGAPFIRDLTGNSRHDIGFAWTEIFEPTSGGAGLFHNTNATTNCSLPPANQLVVHICAPATNGLTVGQNFTFIASGSAPNGIAKRIELWIDGKKITQNLEDQFRANVTLTRGTHVASFVVVDSFDNFTTGRVSFTSQF